MFSFFKRSKKDENGGKNKTKEINIDQVKDLKVLGNCEKNAEKSNKNTNEKNLKENSHKSLNKEINSTNFFDKPNTSTNSNGNKPDFLRTKSNSIENNNKQVLENIVLDNSSSTGECTSTLFKNNETFVNTCKVVGTESNNITKKIFTGGIKGVNEYSEENPSHFLTNYQTSNQPNESKATMSLTNRNNQSISESPKVENRSNIAEIKSTCKSSKFNNKEPNESTLKSNGQNENSNKFRETTSQFSTTSEKMYKNKQPSASDELAPPRKQNDAIAPPKNVVNASKSISNEAATFYEKNDHEIMSDHHYVNGLKVPEPQRRGSCSVKPCGHGTTAIAPRVVISGGNQQLKTPPSSPVLEIKKTLRYKVNDIHETGKGEPEAKRIKENEVNTNNVVSEIDEDLNLNKLLQDQIEDTKKNLLNQEAKFQSQLNDLSKQLSLRDAEATKLRFEMEELQRDVFAKSAGMDRLQSELNAANKECELIRQKIRHLETELENYRIRNSDLVDDLKNKNEFYSNYEIETKSKIGELEGVISNLRIRIQTLEDQIRHLKEEKTNLEKRYEELQLEREEEKKKLTEILESTTKQKEEIERKWKEDFEKLRTINILKEQDLLDDFEWKLREVQQTCKKKLDDKDKVIEERLQEAYKEAQKKMAEAEVMLSQVESLRSYESEVHKLRGKTSEQDRALQEMRDQQQQMLQAEASLKNETKRLLNLIEMEKENLQHIQRLHRQELIDKERKLKETLNQKRTEIAMYWEEKLLHECGRLKDEMEQIHDEEKYKAMEAVRRQKDEEFMTKQNEWEHHLRECLKEIESLKKSLDEKDDFYHDELIRVRSNTDQDIMELRRLMDKIDMAHHENHEKLVAQHEDEMEKINQEHEEKIRELDQKWQSKVGSLSSTLDAAKIQMEEENREKLESLIQQHRDELNSQWENLIHQKSEALNLVQQEYIQKYQTLEEQFYTQQNSHSAREVELLKTIDSLKNELESKNSTLDDLQNTVDTLEGGVQVLNQELAQQNEDSAKVKQEADQKIRSLQQTIGQLLQERDKDRDNFRAQLMKNQRQQQETIDHLERKCQCLTKLFEEVRQRYERRDSRQEDLNIISDLRQVIAEQEKDLACINEEKRYFQMRLMQLERHLEAQSSVEEEEFEDANAQTNAHSSQGHLGYAQPNDQAHHGSNLSLNIPPTILECEDGDE